MGTMKPSLALVFVLLGLTGCGGSPARRAAEAEGPTLSHALNRCIDSEAKLVAQQAAVLDVAAYAVRAKCAAQMKAVRDNMVAQFPGFEVEVRAKFPVLDNAVLERAKEQVALSRTSR
jgi:hypothetical protein